MSETHVPLRLHQSWSCSVTQQKQKKQATGTSRSLIGCGTADLSLQVIRVGMDADFVFRCAANDIRGVEGSDSCQQGSDKV